MTARPLYKVDHSVSDADRIANLERRLMTENEKRLSAEAEAEKWKQQSAKWHALLLKEQIQNTPKREKS